MVWLARADGTAILQDRGVMSAPASDRPSRPPASYRPMTVGDGIRTSASRWPAKRALGCAGRSLSFRELAARIHQVSNGALADLDVAPGERVALMAPNCLEFFEIVCGLAEAALVPTIVNPRLTGVELAYICGDSEARVLFVHSSLEELARSADLTGVDRLIVIGKDYEEWLGRARAQRPSVSVQEWDAFTIAYTSGTTGFPKGAILPHRSRILAVFAMAAEYGCYTDQDRGLLIAPLYHGGGFLSALATTFFGGDCEILPSFDPEQALRSIQESRATHTFMVPTHFHAILSLGSARHRRYDASSLRTLISNAAALPQATKEAVIERFGDGILHEMYGSTEGCAVTNLRPADQLRKKHCVGQPFPCTEIRLLDPEGRDVPDGEIGELFSRSPYLFNGYWRRPEATAATFRGEWFSAGDLARRDDEGYFYIVDRKHDMVISGGVNIYPREVEEVLATHPAVDQVAVVGVPDPYWGEAVQAFVVLRQGATVSDDDLKRHCAPFLARFKLPKRVAFVESLPRNAAGKVLRRELRERAKRNAESADALDPRARESSRS